MSAPFNPLNQEKTFGELLKFPTKVKFKFIGVNSSNLKLIVESFFNEDLKLTVEAKEGNKSTNGKYLTIEAKVKVPSEEVMYRIYREGAKLPDILRVL